MRDAFFDFLDAVIEQCEEVVEELKTKKITPRAAKKKIADFVSGRYDVMMAEYRPFLQSIIMALGPKVGADIVPFTAGLTTLAAAIIGSKEQFAAGKELAKAFAELRKQVFDAYVTAGFSESQAFELVLKQAANSQDSLSRLFARLGQSVDAARKS